MSKTIIVIPVLNEFLGLKQLLNEKVFSGLKNDFLFVDDGSIDGSREYLISLNALNPQRYQLYFRTNKKRGLGNAYRDALRSLKEKDYDYIIQMDGDGSHCPQTISEMLEVLKINNYDLVIGSRYTKGGAIEEFKYNRRLVSRFGNYFCNLVTGNFKIKDWTSGYKVWRKPILDRVTNKTTANGYSFLIETTFYCHKLKGKIYEFPITFKKRVGGESKFSYRIFFEAIKVILSLK